MQVVSFSWSLIACYDLVDSLCGLLLQFTRSFLKMLKFGKVKYLELEFMLSEIEWFIVPYNLFLLACVGSYDCTNKSYLLGTCGNQ